MVECLECGAEIHVLEDIAVGDMVACRVCGESFEVIALEPPEIDYPDDDEAWEGEEWDEEKDWDDDWDDEDADENEPVGPGGLDEVSLDDENEPAETGGLDEEPDLEEEDR